jgi:VWFA-related protein
MSQARRFTVALLLVACLCASAAAQQTPHFQSSVDVTSLDVTVVDGSGHPVSDLAPGDFTVRVSGANRRVLTAQWIPLAPAPGTAAPPPPPAGYSSNQTLVPGRLIVIAVDEPNIRAGNAGAVLRTVEDFVDRLQPADRISAISLGIGGAATPFTDDRNEIKRAIGRMPGQSLGVARLGHNLGLSEALDIAADTSLGAGFSLNKVTGRECGGLPRRDRQTCIDEIENEAFTREQLAHQNTDRTLASMRQILNALKAIDAPKTLVLVSGGLVLFDEEADVLSLGALAAAARTSVYVLTADDLATDTSIRMSGATLSDRSLLFAGLDLLAGASRGTVLNMLGNGTATLAQVEAELSGYYLLGIESDPADKDGKRHPVNVSVNRRGLSVRSRSQILVVADAAPPSARATVTAGLMSPLILSGLPLRVATFSTAIRFSVPDSSSISRLNCSLAFSCG